MSNRFSKPYVKSFCVVTVLMISWLHFSVDFAIYETKFQAFSHSAAFLGLECLLCSRMPKFYLLPKLLLVWWKAYFDDEEISIPKLVC